MPIQTRIQHRRDTATNWSNANPVLAAGEIGYVTSGTNAGYFKIGDGSTAWNSLAFQNLTGPQGTAATIEVGTVTTGAAGSSASVTNTGTSEEAVFDFTIPRGNKGDKGDTGDAATISVGTVTTGNAGSDATVTNSGTTSAAVLDFAIPRGAAATIAVGTVTTGAAGSSATVTNTGTSGEAVFAFSIPRGATGSTGATGPGYSGATSTTSNTLTVGSKTWSVASTGAFAVGNRVRIINAADKYAEGTITSLSANTSITVSVDLVVGSGTYTSWTFALGGLKGDTGTAATISVGTVTTGAAGSSATVTNAGTSSAAVFNFSIPKGDKGDTGSTGSTGPTGATGAGYASSTSSTSQSISTGSKTFTVANTGAFAVGNRVRVINTGSASNYLEGVITSLVANTSITVSVDRTGGSGTITSWTFALAGEVGATGTSLTTGGNRIYVSSTQPSTPVGGWVVGDVWIQI
jgi:hypothetical protein